MKTKIAAAVIAAFTLGAVSLAGTGQAQAYWPYHHHHHGWGGYGFGLAFGPAYYGYGGCYWVRQFDRAGNYIGRARICD